MRRVRGKNTAPEMKVRSLLFAMGYRFRLHRKDLPGNPDIVFPGRKCVIFVHGCFWHGHDCARGARVPKNNRDYWVAKIARNVETIAQMAEQNSAAVAENHATTEELEKLAAALQAEVVRFKVG